MRSGISQKLTATYLIIVLALILSGLFCFFVLDRNQRAYREMRYVTLPSIGHLETILAQNRDLRKLVNTRVFISASKDQDRLAQLMATGNPQLVLKLGMDANNWRDSGERNLFRRIDSLNKSIYDSVRLIAGILDGPESYFNDSLLDKATRIYEGVIRLIGINDMLIRNLIGTKNANLEVQQNSVVTLQRFLYFTVFFTILLVIVICALSWRYAKRQVVSPLLQLEKNMQNMAYGIVDEVPHTTRRDEIGRMQNAISKMTTGVLRKIDFAGKLGKGAYDADFTLLSDQDELGIALLTMRDELKKANETLIEHERRLTEAQRMAKVGNYFVDVETGTIQSSGTLDEILGFSEQNDKKLSVWYQMIAPEFREQYAEVSAKALQEHILLKLTFKVIRRNDGEERWVELIGDRVYDDNGKPKYVYGTIQDINESKLLELELNESYKVATEQNKRLLNFSYIVSHNLRMHAVNIHSLLKMVEETEDPEETIEFLRMLNTASDMLNETMHHLNDVVAMQNTVNVELKPLVLNTHINHAFTVLNTQITQKGAQIYNHVGDEVVINYSPAYLDSVILNFLSNSIKYSHPDRQPVIHIHCNRVHPPHGYAKWVLIISDNGIGIDLARHGSKLFGMYKTFHTNKDAKGIGLFLTKYQIEAMGGSVEVESEPGKGTSFRIYIR